MARKSRKPRPLPTTPKTGVPCPKCGASSRVLRTSLGARLKRAKRDHLLRERICLGVARHRFHTEERPKR